MKSYRTSKKYTLVTMCCDPCVPVFVYNSDRYPYLKVAFDSWVAEEKQEYSGGCSGEFSITLYEHPVGEVAIPELMLYEEEAFVYYVHFPNSKVVSEFTYMDLMRE